MAPSSTPQSSGLRLLALHTLYLKGIAEADVVAEYMDVEPDRMSATLADLERDDLVTYRHGRIPGYMLTPEGRVVGLRMVAEELDATGRRGDVDAAYERFLGFNTRLLDTCTAWQLRTVDGETRPNRHDDPDHDRAVIADLQEVDALVQPVVGALADVLTRFAGHGRRLRFALDRVLAGDHDYFTKPMFPSYHTAWFELHEDLLATLGRARDAQGGS